MSVVQPSRDETISVWKTLTLYSQSFLPVCLLEADDLFALVHALADAVDDVEPAVHDQRRRPPAVRLLPDHVPLGLQRRVEVARQVLLARKARSARGRASESSRPILPWRKCAKREEKSEAEQ